MEDKQKAFEQSGKIVLSEVYKKKGFSKTAQRIMNAATFEESARIAANNEDKLPSSSVLGYVQYMIAKQTVDEADTSDLEGNLFNRFEDEELLEGNGISIVESVPNAAGTTNLNNYQTATGSAGEVFFGTNWSNTPNISMQLNTIQAADINVAEVPFVNRVVGSFDIQSSGLVSLTSIKFNQILNIFQRNIINAVNLIKYAIGNQVFENPLFMPKNGTSVSGLNILKFVRDYLIPTILKMKRPNDQFNAWATPDGKTWAENVEATAWPAWFNVKLASGSFQQNVLTTKAKLKIYMNANVSACLMSIFQIPGVIDANPYLTNIEGSNGVVARICGVEVVVVGTKYKRTAQATQAGQVPILYSCSEYVLGDNQIVIMDDDYFKVAKLMEHTVDSGLMVGTHTALTSKLMQYMPIIKFWKPAYVFTAPDSSFTTPAVLEVNQFQPVSTVKTFEELVATVKKYTISVSSVATQSMFYNGTAGYITGLYDYNCLSLLESTTEEQFLENLNKLEVGNNLSTNIKFPLKEIPSDWNWQKFFESCRFSGGFIWKAK